MRGVPLAELSLGRAIPSAERSGVITAFEYVQWLTDERHIRLLLPLPIYMRHPILSNIVPINSKLISTHDSEFVSHSVMTEGLVVRSIMSGAKFLYHSESKVRSSLITPGAVLPHHWAQDNGTVLC